MPFTFAPLAIPDVILIVPKGVSDHRGCFYETYKKSDFEANGIKEIFVQDNHSISHKGVLRGLHYQATPKAQGKLVRVISGFAWDVAVDLRVDSPNYLKWAAAPLNEENHHMVYVPPGFAHGFVALSDQVHLLYKCTEEYSHAHEQGIRWNDADIAVDWPISEPVISQRDAQLPFISSKGALDAQ